MAAIDLYSGIGGWTLGLKMAGIPVIASYEWWKDANNTHNKNFQSKHLEIDIRNLNLADLPIPGTVKYVVGSPPCTQFSLSNRGGKGDIKDGLKDIKKFLEIVEYLQPQYWAMENVPRVAKILKKELDDPNGELYRFKSLFGEIKIYNSSDFGVPQDRKRMIAGLFPFELFESYRTMTPRINLGDILRALRTHPIIDPIYGIQIDHPEHLTDHVLENNLSEEEARLNREAKTHHPVYNKMSFPDRQDRPSRTITALCTRVSRESIIIEDINNNIRRLSIRERGVLQSFPLNFQFFSSSYGGKLKMIGNAIPPLLTFYIAQSMLETPLEKLLLPGDLRDRLVFSQELAISHTPDRESANFPWNRSFCLAIKELRFGSGMRFELKNHSNKETKKVVWNVNFLYGNSKNIKSKTLDAALFDKAINALDLFSDDDFGDLFNEFKIFITKINSNGLQENWANKNREFIGPISTIDEIAHHASILINYFGSHGAIYTEKIISFIRHEFEIEGNKIDKKLIIKSNEILTGILLGSWFNIYLKKDMANTNVLRLTA